MKKDSVERQAITQEYEDEVVRRALASEESKVLVIYTLQMIGPTSVEPTPWWKYAANLDRLMRETEENLTDLLPAGYRVEIKEWDSDE